MNRPFQQACDDRTGRESMSHPPRITLFRNPVLERLTLTPFPLFLSVWLAVLAVLLSTVLRRQGVAGTAGLAAAGFVVWPFFEYAAHRFVFHWQPRSEAGRKLVFLLHGNHHDDPADPLRSLMPIHASLLLALAIGGPFTLAFGSAGLTLFLGFAAGYVLYDTIHWACHQRPMRGPLARLKRHHLRHHYASQDANFAITAIFLDRIFGSGLNKTR